MKDTLTIAPEFTGLFQRLNLVSVDSIVGFFGGNVKPGKTAVRVLPATLAGADRADNEGRGTGDAVFYKQYDYGRPAWRFIGRPSKAACEYRNYHAFKRLGIPSAEPVAWGERRDWMGRLCLSFIVTRAIPEAMTLVEFVPKHCGAPGSHPCSRLKMRQSLIGQIASMTRRIHDAAFFHRDLVWRNILVTWQSPEEPKAWWIDCPRGGFDHWRFLWRHNRVKDLASLDKLASQHCTPRERALFVKLYLGRDRLDAEAKTLIREVLRYRKRRWPEDW